ncbi:MAG: NAD(P)H-dependent oxidoreductase [Clostridia bacterium]
MKIAVLNGSPKGKQSVTLQSVLYLQAHNKQHEFVIFNIGQQIKKLQNEQEFDKVIEQILLCDTIMFAYPVYTFLVPYQLHRFIEQLKQSARAKEFAGKYVTQLTTSKHFYDYTAHNFIIDNCNDLKLNYVCGLSADMDDLLKVEGRAGLDCFFATFVHCVTNNNHLFSPREAPQTVKPYISTTSTPCQKNTAYDTVILTSYQETQTNLLEMIKEFCAVYPNKTRIININDFKFDGGCLGCFMCATDGKCVYKDGFDTYLRNTIQNANAFIYAFEIKDHSFGSKFKQFDDRQFCNGHRPMTIGSAVGYLISGNYDYEPNLKLVIEGRASVGQNYFAGVATDQNDTKQEISSLSDNLAFALANHSKPSQNFLGVGGNKIFRDLIYVMGGLMKADHKFYKRHNFYDFPQKQLGTKLKMQMVGALMSNKKLRTKMKGKMNEFILKPYDKAIEKSLRDKDDKNV